MPTVVRGPRRFFATVAGLTLFAGAFFKALTRRPFEGRELLRQAYRLGYQSVGLVGVSAFIIGLVLTVQIRPTMSDFGATAYIPQMVAIAVMREIGPVLTAMVCAAKSGAAIGAELGAMAISEQIDAMRVSGARPFNYLVVTRVLALTLMLPLLVFYADALALVGSYVGVNLTGTTSAPLFLSKSLEAISFADLVPATLKSVLFGTAIGLVSCFEGFRAGGGTTGVGRAAKASVVGASLLIFIVDAIAVQLKQFFL